MASDEATPRACALLCQNALAVLRVATLIGTFLRDGVGFWLVTGLCATPMAAARIRWPLCADTVEKLGIAGTWDA
ncbi:hypothetical protein [Ensifer sp. Root127]|uniref:hypothetical protein n=1 Tax=Ensifer sp. Root127 TaxID=1736440 RepID=UPI00070F5A2C|nr:hypothetical protein [Ensifer sp. Root127]KQW65109.1 hypothetical protein ASD03_35700 [Ensifer sp. Root127]